MTCVFSQSGLGTIKGTVKDEVSKQPLPYSKIFLLQNGSTKGNANTDFDGNFQINGIPPGSYDVEVRNADGYQTSVVSGVSVSPDKITFLDKLTLDKPKDIKDLDTDRTKTLQEKQRSIAIAVINREKEAMGKTFDEMQKQFDINIEKILNKGFSTKEEISALLNEIAGAGKSFSSEINGVFTKTMNGLPSAIRTVTDPSIGMFSMTMAALVDQAKKSFGAEVGTANAESILGAAYFMAKGMPDAFKTAFSDGVISQSVTPFVAKVTSIIGNVNVDSIWIEAGRSAIEAMINEMKRKLLGLKGTLYDQFKELFAGMSADYNKLFPELEKLAKEIARIEAIRANADSGGGAEPKKPKPSAGSSTDKYPIDPKSGEHLARRPLTGITASMEDGKKESSFFGSMIDGAKKLAEALGPVKTTILGAVGVIAGLGVLKVIFAAIAAGFSSIASTLNLFCFASIRSFSPVITAINSASSGLPSKKALTSPLV